MQRSSHLASCGQQPGVPHQRQRCVQPAAKHQLVPLRVQLLCQGLALPGKLPAGCLGPWRAGGCAACRAQRDAAGDGGARGPAESAAAGWRLGLACRLGWVEHAAGSRCGARVRYCAKTAQILLMASSFHVHKHADSCKGEDECVYHVECASEEQQHCRQVNHLRVRWHHCTAQQHTESHSKE